MNDNEWMELRAEMHADCINRLTRVIQNSIGSKLPNITFLFNLEWPNLDKPGLITIYTIRPGVLIGYHGTNIDKLKQSFKDEFDHDFDIHIVEAQYIYNSVCFSTVK